MPSLQLQQQPRKPSKFQKQHRTSRQKSPSSSNPFTSFHLNRGQDTPSSSAAGARAGRNARTSFLDIGQRLEADKLALLPWKIPVCMADGDEIAPIRPLALHDVALPLVQEYRTRKMPLRVVVSALALRDFEFREEAHSFFLTFQLASLLISLVVSIVLRRAGANRNWQRKRGFFSQRRQEKS